MWFFLAQVVDMYGIDVYRPFIYLVFPIFLTVTITCLISDKKFNFFKSQPSDLFFRLIGTIQIIQIVHIFQTGIIQIMPISKNTDILSSLSIFSQRRELLLS